MPQVTVYVRDDDLEKWKALEKKAELIHNALHSKNDDPFNYWPDRKKMAEVEESIKPKQMTDAVPKRSGVCKHGFPPAFCRFAKPGKPCK